MTKISFPILSESESELKLKQNNKFRRSKRIYKKNKNLLNIFNNPNIKYICKIGKNLIIIIKNNFY